MGFNSLGYTPSNNVTYASGVTGLAGDNHVQVPFQQTSNLELGLTHLVFKQVRQSDFNTDGNVTVGGDGAILIANLGGTGKSFFQGDTNGDGNVTVGTDGAKLIAQLGTDLVASGAGLAEYDPATGHVLISTNGEALIEVLSAGNQLIPGSAVPIGSVPGAIFQDPPSTSAINYAAFSPLGSGGILNDFDLGAVLPIGLSGSVVANAQFHWAVPGVGEFFAPIQVIPEPSGLVLAGLAGVVFAAYALQCRARSSNEYYFRPGMIHFGSVFGSEEEARGLFQSIDPIQAKIFEPLKNDKEISS